MIAQGTAAGYDGVVAEGYARSMAEHCGDVQQMVQLFEIQRGAMREYVKSGASGLELPYYVVWSATNFTGLEMNALHPFGKELAVLLESCEGCYTDPEDCYGCYGTAEWRTYRGRFGEGTSSKDGLHHMHLMPTVISHLQAA